jgi:UDP-N-acetylmuramoylalanine--D-glutamate ligase
MCDLHGRRVTVLGSARYSLSVAVCRWLAVEGASVVLSEPEHARSLYEHRQGLSELPPTVHVVECREEDFTSADLVVTSTWVRPNNKHLELARAAGVRVMPDAMLFIERCRGQIVGVGGSSGTACTCAMIGHILCEHRRTWVGESGISLLDKLPAIAKDDLVVLNLSSFTLDHLALTGWSPPIAVLRGIEIDPLSFYPTESAYLKSLTTLFRFQKPEDLAVISEESERSYNLQHQIRARVVSFGLRSSSPFELLLPGEPNQLSAQAAYAAVSQLGISWEHAQQALRQFRGLAYRLELVHEEKGIRYYNDSAATKPDAAEATLALFAPGTVIQIVGGHDDQMPLRALADSLAKKAKAALCIGMAGPRIAELIRRVDVRRALVRGCGDLPAAVAAAREIAAPGDAIVLSPGCGSSDQFANFKHRGEAFTRLARGA